MTSFTRSRLLRRSIALGGTALVMYRWPATAHGGSGQPGMTDVRSLGAVGNGRHDDTRAFARALEGGGATYVPPGRYRITRPLEMKLGSRLAGAGSRSVLIHEVADKPLLTMPWAARGWMKLDHLSILGTGSTAPALVVGDPESWDSASVNRIENVLFESLGGLAIHAYGAVGIYIGNCRVVGCAGGIVLDTARGRPCNNFFLEKTSFVDGGDSGPGLTVVAPTDGGTIHRCTFRQLAHSGASVAGEGTNILDCIFIGNADPQLALLASRCVVRRTRYDPGSGNARGISSVGENNLFESNHLLAGASESTGARCVSLNNDIGADATWQVTGPSSHSDGDRQGGRSFSAVPGGSG